MDRRNRPTVLTDAPEHRATARFEIRDVDTNDNEILFVGYASTFEPYEMYGGPSRYGWIEQVDPHAFDKTLREKPDLHLLINHEGSSLARTKSGTLKLSVDNHGLKCEARLDRRDPESAGVEIKMLRGDMDEMSFAFRVKAQKWEAAPGYDDDPESLRTLLEISLHKGDVSIVNFGANDTTHAEIKGIDQALGLLASLDPSAAMAEARSLDATILTRAHTNLAALLGKRSEGDKPEAKPEAKAADSGPEPEKRRLSLHEALKEQGLASDERLTLTQIAALEGE